MRWRSNLIIALSVTVAASCLGISAGCKPKAPSALKGSSNVSLTFYGKAVDQDGNALPGATFEFDVEAYSGNGSFTLSPSPNTHSSVHAVSDAQGLFEFPVTGCRLRTRNAACTGYRQLEEVDSATYSANGGNSVHTRGIQLSATDPHYQSSPNHPAVFVFVRDGVHSCAALPSQGGYRSSGSHWVQNQPAWPFEPSLDDVDWTDGQPRINKNVWIVVQVVDTAGHSMPNVDVSLSVGRYRELEEMRRGGDVFQSTKRTRNVEVMVRTDASGLGRMWATGFKLSGVRARVAGTELFPVLINPCNATPDGDFYARQWMDSSGNVIWRCDDSNPLVLVMAKKGERDSQVMPSRGGFELLDGAWTRVAPSWPKGFARDISRYMGESPVPR
jgi:hypothetical protein